MLEDFEEELRMLEEFIKECKTNKEVAKEDESKIEFQNTSGEIEDRL